MARGSTLNQLLIDLRAELRRAAAPDDTASLMVTLNHVYDTLYLTNDWPFLNTQFTPITLNAGQRYYDFPTGLNPDRVISQKVYWSSNYSDVERGISEADYNSFDPAQNQRSSPMLKWDVRFTGTTEQIEVWPIPDGTAQSLHFYGTYKIDRLVNLADTCKLDDFLVVLGAATELLPKDSADKETKSQLFKERLRMLKVRANAAGGPRFTNGLGVDTAQKVHPRAVVRISGG